MARRGRARRPAVNRSPAPSSTHDEHTTVDSSYVDPYEEGRYQELDDTPLDRMTAEYNLAALSIHSGRTQYLDDEGVLRVEDAQAVVAAPGETWTDAELDVLRSGEIDDGSLLQPPPDDSGLAPMDSDAPAPAELVHDGTTAGKLLAILAADVEDMDMTDEDTQSVGVISTDSVADTNISSADNRSVHLDATGAIHMSERTKQQQTADLSHLPPQARVRREKEMHHRQQVMQRITEERQREDWGSEAQVMSRMGNAATRSATASQFVRDTASVAPSTTAAGQRQQQQHPRHHAQRETHDTTGDRPYFSTLAMTIVSNGMVDFDPPLALEVLMRVDYARWLWMVWSARMNQPADARESTTFRDAVLTVQSDGVNVTDIQTELVHIPTVANEADPSAPPASTVQCNVLFICKYNRMDSGSQRLRDTLRRPLSSITNESLRVESDDYLMVEIRWSSCDTQQMAQLSTKHDLLRKESQDPDWVYTKGPLADMMIRPSMFRMYMRSVPL